MTPPPPPPDGHELGFDLPPPAAISRPRILALVAAGVALVGAAFVIGYVPRRAEHAALVEATRAADPGLLRVDVVKPTVASSNRALSLPGSVQPLEETTIYARASGYVRKWYADIGDKVKEGQVLAELDTPELDQELDQGRAQLLQAQATLVQSRANRELSQTNLQRYKQLAPSGVVSQADLDQRKAMAEVDDATVNVAQASIAAQQANMRRLTQLKSFARVTAPFGGTVTQRTIEVGSLVTSGNGQPMYKVASMDPARVFIQVPQDVSPSVRAGIAAKVTLREYAGRDFQGTVARAAGELDPLTRTMTTEVRVPNGDGALIAGMYAQVALTLPSPHRVFEVPATAVASDAHGSRVVVERDTGPTVEIASGLDGTERVAKLASAQFVDGKIVQVASP
jgi:RND family efflux transporter MFP subunit